MARTRTGAGDPLGGGASTERAYRNINNLTRSLEQLNASLNINAQNTTLATRRFTAFNRSLNIGRIVSYAFAIRGIAQGLSNYVQVGVDAVRVSAEFERSLRKLEGITNVARQDIEAMVPALRDLAQISGREITEIGEALFFINSAGIKGAEGLRVLETAAKATAVGLGDTATVGQLLGAAINAYGSENLTAAEAGDVLIATIEKGIIVTEDLARQFGETLPFARNLGVEFQQVGALFAALTRTGTPAFQAATQIKNIFRSLVAPTQQTRKALDEFNVDFTKFRTLISDGDILTAIAALEAHLISQTGSQEAASAAFREFFPDVRALSATIDLLGASFDSSVDIMEYLLNTTGNLDDAFEALGGSVAFQAERVQSSFSTLQESLASLFTPAIAGALDNIAGGISTIVTEVENLNPEFVAQVSSEFIALGESFREFLEDIDSTDIEAFVEQMRGLTSLFLELTKILLSLPGLFGRIGHSIDEVSDEARKGTISINRSIDATAKSIASLADTGPETNIGRELARTRVGLEIREFNELEKELRSVEKEIERLNEVGKNLFETEEPSQELQRNLDVIGDNLVELTKQAQELRRSLGQIGDDAPRGPFFELRFRPDQEQQQDRVSPLRQREPPQRATPPGEVADLTDVDISPDQIYDFFTMGFEIAEKRFQAIVDQIRPNVEPYDFFIMGFELAASRFQDIVDKVRPDVEPYDFFTMGFEIAANRFEEIANKVRPDVEPYDFFTMGFEIAGSRFQEIVDKVRPDVEPYDFFTMGFEIASSRFQEIVDKIRPDTEPYDFFTMGFEIASSRFQEIVDKIRPDTEPYDFFTMGFEIASERFQEIVDKIRPDTEPYDFFTMGFELAAQRFQSIVENVRPEQYDFFTTGFEIVGRRFQAIIDRVRPEDYDFFTTGFEIASSRFQDIVDKIRPDVQPYDFFEMGFDIASRRFQDIADRASYDPGQATRGRPYTLGTGRDVDSLVEEASQRQERLDFVSGLAVGSLNELSDGIFQFAQDVNDGKDLGLSALSILGSVLQNIFSQLISEQGFSFLGIPGFQSGGIVRGLARVGEAGPEIINVGSPSRVFSNAESRSIGGSPVINITVNADNPEANRQAVEAGVAVALRQGQELATENALRPSPFREAIRR